MIKTMSVYNLYVFNKYGVSLYYDEWNRLKKSGISHQEEAKLMYGMLFSIKSFVNKMSPIDNRTGFAHFKTNKYALHYLETPSGFKFVISTDKGATNVQDFLQQFYGKIWMEYVVRDPLWTPGSVVTSEIFKQKANEFVKKFQIYGIKNI